MVALCKSAVTRTITGIQVMADGDSLVITLTAETLPPPACYATEQDRFNAYVAAIQVNVSGGIQWVTQSGAPSDLTAYWLKTDSNGVPIGAYKWETGDGEWVPLVQGVIFGSGAGTANAFTVTNAPTLTGNGLFTVGRILTFISNQTNSGASTLSVDSGPTHSIKKAGTADIESGDIVTGQMVIVIWDGTNWQIQNPIKPQPSATTHVYFDSGLQTVPTADNALISLPHGIVFGNPSTAQVPQTVEWYLVCNDPSPVSPSGSTALQYSMGDRILVESLCNKTDSNIFIPQIVNDTTVQIGPFPWSTVGVCVVKKLSGGTGGDGAGGFSWTITSSQWRLQCIAIYTPPT